MLLLTCKGNTSTNSFLWPHFIFRGMIAYNYDSNNNNLTRLSPKLHVSHNLQTVVKRFKNIPVIIIILIIIYISCSDSNIGSSSYSRSSTSSGSSSCCCYCCCSNNSNSNSSSNSK